MTFFTQQNSRRSRPGGWLFLGLFIVTLGSLLALPTGYVIERPGQSFNVMGELQEKPVISSETTQTFDSETRFDVLTVSLLGNRESTPSWIQLIAAWIDPDQIVLPLDEVYPPNVSTEQIRAESAAQMEVSQQDAIAAALTHLGYEVPRSLYISQVFEDAPASGKLVAADLIDAVNGQPVATIEELRAAIGNSAGAELTVSITRDGLQRQFKITPELNQENWVIGIGVSYVYDFPVDLELQLGDVGGPSGGLIFTLGIIDKLTPGSLFGDTHIAGTGTISATGEVGAIGGIELKMIAAKNSGADLFIGPRANCGDLVGNEPAGLPVAVVSTLQEALAVSQEFQETKSVSSEFSCTTE